MGEVYRAHDSRLQRFVAVKCLSSEVTGDARARLLDEARAAAALNHPHICTIHEVADIDQQFFIVMELVDGRVLSWSPLKALRSRRRFDTASRLPTPLNTHTIEGSCIAI